MKGLGLVFVVKSTTTVGSSRPGPFLGDICEVIYKVILEEIIIARCV